jgi:hypothetical protein
VLITIYDVAIVLPLLVEHGAKVCMAMRRVPVDAEDSSVHPARSR